jgi:hypothetical protein
MRKHPPVALVTALGFGVLGLSPGGTTLQAGTASQAKRTPRTLFLTKSQITAFAQDGERIAWMSLRVRGKCRVILHILTLHKRRATTFNRIGCWANISDFTGVYGELALAGDRALWKTRTGYGNTETDLDIQTASVRDQGVRRVGELQIDQGAADAPLAGQGALLVFYSQQDALPGDPRRVKRLIGHSAVSLFDIDRAARPPIDLAVDRNRIAVLRATRHGGTFIEVRAGIGGALLGTFRSKGAPRAVAISRRLVAVLTVELNKREVRFFDARSGAPRGNLRVSPYAEGLVASGRWVVFWTASDNAIRLLDTRSRKVSVAAIAKGRPIGLSVSGRRLAWAEALSRGSRIRSLTLPAG